MKKIIKLFIICLLIFNLFSVGILSLHAELVGPTQSGAPLGSTAANGLLPDTESGGAPCPTGYDKGAGGNCGNYSLNDMVSVVLKASEFILGVVGSLALLAFVVGGMMWVLSAGNAELVTRGKQTILGAVIGLVIVFTSFMIIQLVYASLGLGWKGESSFPKATDLPVTPSS